MTAKDPYYRVAIFGSARIQKGDAEYGDVFRIAKGLAEAGYDVVTGGGPGLMEAANAGHQSAMTGALSIGLPIKLPREEQANKYLDIKKDFSRFSARLDTFVSLSDAAIVATGGIGTLLELFYSWQLIQVQDMCETPVVLFGEMWGGLLEWLRSEVLARRLFDGKDMRGIFHIRSADGVVRFIRRVHQDRLSMEHICVNYDRYREEFEAPAGGNPG